MKKVDNCHPSKAEFQGNRLCICKAIETFTDFKRGYLIRKLKLDMAMALCNNNITRGFSFCYLPELWLSVAVVSDLY